METARERLARYRLEHPSFIPPSERIGKRPMDVKPSRCPFCPHIPHIGRCGAPSIYRFRKSDVRTCPCLGDGDSAPIRGVIVPYNIWRESE